MNVREPGQRAAEAEGETNSEQLWEGVGGWMIKLLDMWMDKWIDGWVDGWMDMWMDKVVTYKEDTSSGCENVQKVFIQYLH